MIHETADNTAQYKRGIQTKVSIVAGSFSSWLYTFFCCCSPSWPGIEAAFQTISSCPAYIKTVAILCNTITIHTSYIRCMGQENPCEDISLGSCLVEPGSIINTLSFPPDKCAKFCQLDNNCEFWRARWDGTQCHLLSSDYQHVSITRGVVQA